MTHAREMLDAHPQEMDMEHCRACAEACRYCEEVCNRALSAVGAQERSLDGLTGHGLEGGLEASCFGLSS
jgi:hypothetical protein